MEKKETKTAEGQVAEGDLHKLPLKEKIARITGEIDPIQKSKRKGDTVSFAYRSIDDVMNALNPMLYVFGITLQSQVVKVELHNREFQKEFKGNMTTKIVYTALVHLRLIFSDQSGEQEVWEEVAMSEDYSDKAVTQAMSMAYKYGITRKFCIPFGDGENTGLPDGDSRNPDYRDTSEEGPPKRKPWLNEGTKEWDDLVSQVEQTGDPEKVLARFEQEFSINAKQRKAIMDGNFGNSRKPLTRTDAPENKEAPKAEKEAKPADNPSKGFDDKLLEEYKKADKETLHIKGSQPNEMLRIFHLSLGKLKAGEVTLETVAKSFPMSDGVKQFILNEIKTK